MITTEWLAQARKDQEVLGELVDCYYPTQQYIEPDTEISAPGAQFACDVCCADIVAKNTDARLPSERLAEALANNNIEGIMNLLNGAWFGVPESRGCWGIVGFSEAVALLEDPPEDFYGEEKR